ncbi:MAG: hypothetical protein LBU89_03805 [Fibromonadaceae bacterium]|jgi:hypothetical protein|nr:hypothetical protein [Fibromonadaceae bacterium]
METLLIFFAIIAIQVIASYFKQKKEAEKRKNAPPKQKPIPQEAVPIPDPFREIREMMGLPEEEPQILQEPEPEPEPEPKFKEPEPELVVFKHEGIAPKSLPFQSIADRYSRASTSDDEPVQEASERKEVCKLKIHNALDIKNLRQGILWTTILHQPRFRTGRKFATRY